MPSPTEKIALSLDEIRAVTAFACRCAMPVLALFERDNPADRRPREALEAALAFAEGAPRTTALRTHGWAGFKAAREAVTPVSTEAAHAACQAASAAFLHPLADAMQVKHILGAAGYAAHAIEVEASGGESASIEARKAIVDLASPTLVSVLSRYPASPPGGGRVGEIMREIDKKLRP